MPLSEHEQRILDEIERRLAQEDPKFAREVSSATPYGQSLRRLKRAIAGFVLGFVLLLGALIFNEIFLLLGIAAFAVMLVSAVAIASTAKTIGKERRTQEQKPPRWIGKMEDRWRKRFDKDEN